MAKSILIKDTTRLERIEILKESLDFGGAECEGIDVEDLYEDYIDGVKELADINREFSEKHAGMVVSGDREESGRSCVM